MLRTLRCLGSLVGAVAASACFHPTYDHPACGPADECPSGTTCQAGFCESMQGISQTQTFDFAGLQTGQLVNMTVDTDRASLTPNAYTYGGLAVFGLAGRSMWTRVSDPPWSAIAGVVPTGTALWRGEAISSTNNLSPTNNLAYLGMTDLSANTLWLAGEVWLDAGASERFTIGTSDVAFVDLAQPDTTDYARLTETSGTVSVAVPVSGWYPIRIGFGSTVAGSNFQFSFMHSDVASGAAVAWTRDRLRARASELRGTVRTMFYQLMLGGGAITTATQTAQPPVVTVDGGDLMPEQHFDNPPQGVDAISNDYWSARYAGQVYIPAAGTYTLIVDTDDGNRLRLGSQRTEANWSGNVHAGTSVLPAALPAGWNDLTVDYEQTIGGRHLIVQLVPPDGSMPPISHTQLRPVEPADDRLAYGNDDVSHPIALDPTQPATAQIPIAGYTGELVRGIELALYVTTQNVSSLTATLVTPDGVQAPLQFNIDSSRTPANSEIEIAPGATGAVAALLGGRANGTWKLIVGSMASASAASTLLSAKLTLHTSGGPDKIARTASWISPPIDAATSAIGIDSITWDARTPAGTSAAAKVRACEQADCSDAPAWSDSAAMTAQSLAAPGRYLQVRVDVTGDGTTDSELKSVTVAFRRASS